MSQIGEFFARQRRESVEVEAPLLSDESHWYTEQALAMIVVMLRAVVTARVDRIAGGP